MFYVRLRAMVKNQTVTVFNRYPEQTAVLKKLGDLFGKAGVSSLPTGNLPLCGPINSARGCRSHRFRRHADAVRRSCQT